MKKTKTPTIAAILMIVLLTACDNNTCPEGSLPILDQNGDLITCSQAFDSEEQSKVQSEIQLYDSKD